MKYLPHFLKPVFKVWMAFAELLGWIMTRVILIILFYAVLTPTALVARVVFRKRFLDLYFEDSKKSYWHSRAKSDFKASDYERQF